MSKLTRLAVAVSSALTVSAVFAEGDAAQDHRLSHWAYQPVVKHEVPRISHEGWARTPVDGFILAKLEGAGIAPSPAADRATFIRRASLDVLGYVPSPEEVEAFVQDASPDAYEKLVERLLASEQFGVRQARRWLDLARYADTTGFGDRIRENMWRYRDYVVDAFNHDKPYDRFVKEQIAGDELGPDNPESLIATGFLANYPDNHNSRDMVQRKYQITTDIVDTIGDVFLAQSVQCARCHDHKFDPLTQKEYFQLQSFFSNTAEVNDIPAPVGEVEQEYRAQLAKWEEATAEIRAKREALIDPLRTTLVNYQRGRYFPDTRASLAKPESEWNGVDRWINHRWNFVTEGDDYNIDRYMGERIAATDSAEERAKYQAIREEAEHLSRELRKFESLRPEEGSDKISAMTELGHPDAPPTFVFFGGDYDRPLDEVQPGFPAYIAHGKEPNIKASETSSGRRTAFAEWIASEENPLTARVFVNRVWEQYFGTGLVKTVSNFGLAGEQPTHPELLDYLASDFIEHGWSIKHLHRQILLSAAYRQSSAHREEAFAADPENKLLGVFPRRRFEAEQIRDSLLAAAGLLNTELGGPSVLPPVPDELNAGNRWNVSKDEPDHYRRSLYVFTRRSLAYPLFQPFDMASPQQTHARRDVTTSPLQALTLYNSEIVLGWSKALAGRVIREVGSDEAAQIDRLYQLLFSRAPKPGESELLTAFLDRHAKVLAEQAAEGTFAANIPTGVELTDLNPLRAAAFVDLVHTVANSNEFSYRF